MESKFPTSLQAIVTFANTTTHSHRSSDLDDSFDSQGVNMQIERWKEQRLQKLHQYSTELENISNASPEKPVRTNFQRSVESKIDQSKGVSDAFESRIGSIRSKLDSIKQSIQQETSISTLEVLPKSNSFQNLLSSMAAPIDQKKIPTLSLQ